MRNHVLLQALTTLKTMIFLDLRHLFRRASTSVVLLVLALILLGFVLTLGSFHQMVSVYAPFHGISNPKYGLGGYEPLLFYLCVLVPLVFATRLPNYLEDTDESVVVTFRPPSNFLLSLSRVLTPTLLVALFLVLISLGYQGIASFTRFGFMELIEPWSLVFVLINLSMALFFWTSLAVLIAQVFKSGAVGFIGTTIILMVQAIVSPLLPWDLSSFTFGYSAASLYVSDIAPDYFQVKHFIYWISVLCISVALVVQSSVLLGRTDQSKRTVYVPVVISLTLVCLVCQAIVHVKTFSEANQRQAWVQAYKDASQLQTLHSVVTAIHGEVRIAPGSNVDIDLTYKINFADVQTQNSPSNSVVKAFLALNPGMQVEEILCDGTNLSYAHKNGILEVDLAPCNYSSAGGLLLSFEASGRPDPHYLVGHLPSSSRSDINPELVRLVGQRSSIFTSDYVALTPMSHWYPQPVQPATTKDDEHVTVPIDVNVGVELERKSWTLVSSRGELLRPENSEQRSSSIRGKYRSLGLIASDFRVERNTLEDLKVNVLIHRRHAHKFEGEHWLKNGIVRYVNQAISRLKSYGIAYPYSTFSIVEAPTTLSLLNEERGTDLGMDSILMYRESEAPFSRFDLYVDWLKRRDPDHFEFAQDQIEYMIWSCWTNSIFSQTYEDSVIGGVLSRYGLAQGNQSRLSNLLMGQLLLAVIEEVDWMPNYRFDFDLANTLSRKSQLNMRYIASRLRGMITPFNLQDSQETHLNSHAFWESIEESFSQAQTDRAHSAPTKSEQYMREQRFRVRKLVEIIEASLDQETIASTVADIFAKAKSRPIDLKMISTEFLSDNLDVQPLVESTLLSNKLPGVYFSVLRHAPLDEPDDQGYRYVSAIDIRSGEDVGAQMLLRVEESEGNQEYETWAGETTLGPFNLPGKTSYTLVFRTMNRVTELHANTFLTLNRGEFGVPVQSMQTLPAADLLEFEGTESYSLVPSDWHPNGDQNTIIVDDLDPGFEAASPTNRRNQSWLALNSGLFRSYRPRESGLDNGLPIASYPNTHTGIWARSSWGTCWGRYRHTYVFSDTSKKPKQDVSFNTELSLTGRWMLSYHFLSSPWHGEYDIRVTVGSQEWDLGVDTQEWHEGWNVLGNLHIDKPGHARVTLSNESDAAYVFADAIKWTYLDSD